MQNMSGRLTISRLCILWCFWLLFRGNLSLAQYPQFGSDSLRCLASLSVMSEFARMKLYDNAYEAWVDCFTNCPAASRNIYIFGADILRYKIEALAASPERENLIDTLMLLYDRRMQYFGQEGFVTGRKGLDLLKYRPAELEKACGMLLACMETEGSSTEGSVLVNLMQAASVLYRNGKMEAERLTEIYQKISGIADLTAGITGASGVLVRENADRIFLSSGAANCETFNARLLQLIQQQPADTGQLSSTLRLMSKSGCSSPTLVNGYELLFMHGPSAALATRLADLYAEGGNYAKALEFLNRALELESDARSIARIYYQMGIVFQQQGDYPRAREMALKALEKKADMGEAYLAIAIAYASPSVTCGSNPLEQGAVFWAAVDQLIKAKQTDPSLTARVDELISRFSAYFPDSETAFFNGYVDGDSYSVGCWINEMTRVRTRKTN